MKMGSIAATACDFRLRLARGCFPDMARWMTRRFCNGAALKSPKAPTAEALPFMTSGWAGD
jgi:hypothetical protein